MRSSSNQRLSNKPRRPARSVQEIRRRQLGDAYQSPFERLLYAVLNGLLYGFGGVLIDLAIVLICSILGIGSGQVFWLFAPFLFVIGAVIGLIDGKNSGADSMDMLNGAEHPHLDDRSIKHDIFRGLGTGIAVFAVIWLVLMIMR